MSTEKTDALVIRVADFSETSRVVTFFSREFGKLAAVAKGGRRLKGPFESALDLLSTCRIVFIRKSSSGLDLLTEAQLASRFRPLERDLSSLYGGYYVAELLEGLSEDYDPHPVLYDEAIETLRHLSEDSQSRLAVLRFELITLREIGQLPMFDHCIVCGEDVTEQNTFGFWVSQGGLICNRCGKEEYSHTHIHAGTAAVLRRLTGANDGSWRRLAVSEGQLREMRRVTTAAISAVLGRRPKMLKYLRP